MGVDGQQPWLDGVEGNEPIRLIQSDAPLIRAVAGPGSGKSFCLARRVQRLVTGERVAPRSIFVGTFTRAIAKGLREDLSEEISVSTLHAYAYKLLRDHPHACQGMELRFLLGFEEEALLHDIADEVDYDGFYERRDALARLQSARSERAEIPDARFAGAVRRWLVHHGGMLVNEVAYLATTGLENGDIPGGTFDSVIIDEYQDLTAAEQDLIERIWSGEGSLVVLGDNDQSIYSFRYNHPEGVNEFRARWEADDLELDDVDLPENRRCGNTILTIANQMMAEAGSDKPPMVHKSGREGSVDLVHWPTVDDEIQGLAEHVLAQPDETFLVLVPRRIIGYALADAVGDEAATSFKEEALEHKFARERFALASVLANPGDRVALRGWLGFHADGAAYGPRRNADAYSTLPVPDSSLDLARGIVEGRQEVAGIGSQNIVARCKSLLEVAQDLEDLTLAETISYLFDSDVVTDDLEHDDFKRERLVRSLDELEEGALVILEASEGASLADVMETLRYRISVRTDLATGDDEDEVRVRIMTLHSAKGLEAENVIVAGAADGMIPGLREDDAEEQRAHEAEQRRLLYVAVTRAKNRLVISWPREMPSAMAHQNSIRVDRVTYRGGEGHAQLGRTSLLPQALPGGVPGATWLGG